MLGECPAINGEVMVRTYRADGTFYKSGWTSLLTLWDRGYLIPMVSLQYDGRARLVTHEGTVELILVD